MSQTSSKPQRGGGEASFTLIETVIALAIVAYLIVEVAIVQGNALVFSDYGRNISQATWLARRVMSRVEYYWRSKPFKELITHQGDQKFDDFDEYTYTLDIAEWKFPFAKLLEQSLGGGGKAKRDKDKKDDLDARSSSVDSGTKDMVETVVKQVFGDEPIFLMATVNVGWAEGAQRNQTTLTYLMTNQAKLDEAIISMKSVYDKLTKPPWTRRIRPTPPPEALIPPAELQVALAILLQALREHQETPARLAPRVVQGSIISATQRRVVTNELHLRSV